MSEHTPGPWQVLEYAIEKKGFIAVVGPGGHGNPAQHICDVFPFGKRAEGTTLEGHKANARLIAAAPDLLEAMRKLTTEITSNQALMDNVSLMIFEDAIAAIEKAEHASHKPDQGTK